MLVIRHQSPLTAGLHPRGTQRPGPLSIFPFSSRFRVYGAVEAGAKRNGDSEKKRERNDRSPKLVRVDSMGARKVALVHTP